MLLEMTGLQQNAQRETTTIHTQEEEKSMIIKTLLLGKTLYDSSPIQNIYIHSTQTNLQEKIGKEMIEKRGNDATRLCLIQERDIP